MKSRFLLPGLLALALCGAPCVSASYLQHAEIPDYLAELQNEHGFKGTDLRRWFSAAERKQSIIDAISRPAERVLEWKDYRKIFIQPQRIVDGVAFWQRNADALARASKRFGVAPEYIVAIIGVETRYGKYMGNYRVLDALSTLAFDYPPRAKFFRKELTQYLLLAREEGVDPLELVGSYAGAMGYGQFIPSSFREYAIDFTGDGRRDILTNETDAIGSVANYLARHGWRNEADVIVPVAVTSPGIDELANETLKLTHKVGDLRARGLEVPQSVADDASGALFRMQADAGVQYWLGLNDFYSITRYNHSSMYALAVYQLAGQIRRAR
ncbi:MAG: lytic murein transglycosylase B [Pseudomonadota bacterium]